MITTQDLRELLLGLPPGTEVCVVQIKLPDNPPPPDEYLSTPDVAPEPASHANPEMRLKVRSVARRVGIAEREFRRAIKGGFLRYRTKRGGRDDGAFLIDDEDLAEYQARREAIRGGDADAPEGWPGPVRAFL